MTQRFSQTRHLLLAGTMVVGPILALGSSLPAFAAPGASTASQSPFVVAQADSESPRRGGRDGEPGGREAPAPKAAPAQREAPAPHAAPPQREAPAPRAAPQQREAPPAAREAPAPRAAPQQREAPPAAREVTPPREAPARREAPATREAPAVREAPRPEAAPPKPAPTPRPDATPRVETPARPGVAPPHAEPPARPETPAAPRAARPNDPSVPSVAPARPDATRPPGAPAPGERARPDAAGQPLTAPLAPNGRTDQRNAPANGTQQGVAPLSPQGQPRDPSRTDQRGGADRDQRDRFDTRADRPRVEERDGRTFTRENDNRVIIREGDREIIRHDETERLRRGARNVDIVDRPNGRREVVIVRPDGDRIVTLVDEDGNLLRRTRRGRDGRDFVLIDNERGRPANGFYAPVVLPPLRLDIPRDRYIVEAEDSSYEVIEDTLLAPPVERVERAYSLDEVRTNQRLREKVRRVDIDTITFPTGSAEIAQNEAARLDTIARAINGVIAKNPNEVFLVEGHTDAVGGDRENLTLSDRRAESVAAVLSERYQIPPENLVTQGYGEQYLKVQSQGAEQQNRRVTLRRITPLLQESQKR